MRIARWRDRLRTRAGTPASPSSGAASGTRTEPEVMAAVDQLVDAGAMEEAIDLLEAHVEASGEATAAGRLVTLRHRALETFDPVPRQPWPPPDPDPAPGLVGELPEVHLDELTPEILGGAVLHHGALVVRGMFPADQVARTIELIERVDDLRSRSDDGRSLDEGWYRPFEHVTDMDRSYRSMVASQGGTWLADSPRGLSQVMGDLNRVGVIEIIGEYFGERPAISLQKCTLRRNEPVYNLTGWHQDGSFMGEDARAMNVWVALTDTGGDRPTPGLELVPGRVDEILPRDGGLGSASISDATVAAAAGARGTVVPRFDAGDALMFDGYFVHRTHLAPDMENVRYALESWFFAPSSPATKYQSFLI